MALIRPIPSTESPKAVCYLNLVNATIANVVTGTKTQGDDGGSTTNGDYTWGRTRDNVKTFTSAVDCKGYVFLDNGTMEERSFTANTTETINGSVIIVI